MEEQVLSHFELGLPYFPFLGHQSSGAYIRGPVVLGPLDLN